MKVEWVMVGTVCADDHIFFLENKLYIKEKIFIHQSTVLAVKRVELVSDRMPHIVMRGCR
jgi:hypothetical protein